MGRKKKVESIKHLLLDFTGLADMAEERTQAEGVLQQANTLPPEVVAQHGPGLLAEIESRTAKVVARRKDANDQAAKAIEPLAKPLLDIYDAIRKTIRGRLGMPPDAVETGVVDAPAAESPWEITVTNEAEIPAKLKCLDRALLSSYLDYHHKQGTVVQVPGISYARKAGR